MRESPIREWPEFRLLGALTVVVFTFHRLTPWLVPWLHANFADRTASIIRFGINAFLYVGIAGCLITILRRCYAQRS
jgi:hypothetical protein